MRFRSAEGTTSFGPMGKIIEEMLPAEILRPERSLRTISIAAAGYGMPTRTSVSPACNAESATIFQSQHIASTKLPAIACPVDRSNHRHRATVDRQNHFVDRIEQSALFVLAVLRN